ncbi:MAG: VOC family protein [Phycisphaerae bacterium]
MGGNICHVEISVTDMAAARKFYGDAFGWTFPMAGDEYTIFKAGDGVGGGLELCKERKSDGAVTIYIYVDDIPAALDKIVKAGGKAERPKTEIPSYGFMATFRDPCGNKMALFTAK